MRSNAVPILARTRLDPSTRQIGATQRSDGSPPDPSEVHHWRTRSTVWLFATASFTGAALLFLIQPMVAKMVLPLLGGSPAVWNTAMVFFQALLLAGYGYAHVSTRLLGPRRQSIVHVAVLGVPLLALPIAIPAWAPPAQGVVPWLLLLLLLSAGLPYFAVTTASPLLQRWFAEAGGLGSHDPYFLYAAGNAGSVIGLLAFPTVVEPFLSVAAQTRLWAAGYIVFVVLAAACVTVLRRSHSSGVATMVSAQPSDAIAWLTRFRWVGLAFIPSSLMLGVTTYLSTDVAAFPLLWIIPLSLYLGTFILAFARRQLISMRTVRIAVPVLGLPAVLVTVLHIGKPVAAIVLLHLAALFAISLGAHGKLATERPHVHHLTEFYLLISVGGVLGGLFNALLAPSIFDSLLEYPLVLLLAILVLTPVLRLSEHRVAGLSIGVVPATLGFLVLLAAGVAAGVGTQEATSFLVLMMLFTIGAAGSYVFGTRPARFLYTGIVVILVLALATPMALHTDRTFFGIHRVTVNGDFHLLGHGTTLHGAEARQGPATGESAMYYSAEGPMGEFFASRGYTDRVAVVGLGTGGLAAFAHPGQTMTFFEIDPAVVQIASDPALFSYLSSTKGDVDVVLGDGRLSLQQEGPQSFDVIILDAFASAAIPVHLLTLEAITMYLEKLRPGGVLLFHVTNRYLDVAPVLAGIAQDLAVVGAFRADEVEGSSFERTSSRWVVLTREPEFLAALSAAPWEPLADIPASRPWTDDYSNILRALRWW